MLALFIMTMENVLSAIVTDSLKKKNNVEYQKVLQLMDSCGLPVKSLLSILNFVDWEIKLLYNIMY